LQIPGLSLPNQKPLDNCRGSVTGWSGPREYPRNPSGPLRFLTVAARYRNCRYLLIAIVTLTGVVMPFIWNWSVTWSPVGAFAGIRMLT